MAYVWLHRLVMIKPFSDSLLFSTEVDMNASRFKYSESTNLIFLSGNGSGFVKSDLEIPAPFPKLLSLTCYFLLDLREGGTNQSGITVGALAVLSLSTPFLCSSLILMMPLRSRQLMAHQRRNFHYSWISERTRD